MKKDMYFEAVMTTELFGEEMDLQFCVDYDAHGPSTKDDVESFPAEAEIVSVRLKGSDIDILEELEPDEREYLDELAIRHFCGLGYEAAFETEYEAELVA